MTEYERWLSVELDDPDLKEELLSVKDQPEEINDRFYRDLAFGTGGLRGVIGAGTNRMNVYTVRKATQGLANYLNKHNTEGKPLSVAIAHDSRRACCSPKSPQRCLPQTASRRTSTRSSCQPRRCPSLCVTCTVMQASALPQATTRQSTTAIRPTATMAAR